MATCDTCGNFYTFGTLRTGSHSFCSGSCQERGKVLSALEGVPQASIDRYVDEAHRSDCPKCGGCGPIDIYASHWVWSAFVFTRWGTDREVECGSCARRRQLRALLFCLAFGWWGFPFGLIITPVQVFRNIAATFNVRTTPSESFHRMLSFGLARRLKNEELRAET